MRWHKIDESLNDLEVIFLSLPLFLSSHMIQTREDENCRFELFLNEEAYVQLDFLGG